VCVFVFSLTICWIIWFFQLENLKRPIKRTFSNRRSKNNNPQVHQRRKPRGQVVLQQVKVLRCTDHTIGRTKPPQVRFIVKCQIIRTLWLTFFQYDYTHNTQHTTTFDWLIREIFQTILFIVCIIICDNFHNICYWLCLCCCEKCVFSQSWRMCCVRELFGTWQYILWIINTTHTLSRSLFFLLVLLLLHFILQKRREWNGFLTDEIHKIEDMKRKQWQCSINRPLHPRKFLISLKLGSIRHLFNLYCLPLNEWRLLWRVGPSLLFSSLLFSSPITETIKEFKKKKQ
jgi:hypothetical protein